MEVTKYMQDFLSRKQKYFEKLYENPEVVEAIINDERNKEKKELNVIFNPSTENELSLANSIITLFIDINKMATADLNDIDKPDYYNNFFLMYMNDIISALKEKNLLKIEEIGNELKNYESPEKTAVLVYDMMRAFMYDVEDLLSYLAERNEFDWYDSSQSEQFTIYFQQANAILNSFINSPMDTQEVDFENNQIIEYFQTFSKTFDQLYKKDFLKTKKLQKRNTI